MKEIKTNKFENKQADLEYDPPIFTEDKDDSKKLRKKKKKKLYQLNRIVDDFEDV
jgi:hypothetical protein